MRFYKTAETDDWEAPEPVAQDDQLRRLVDLLAPVPRHLVERTFFGGVYLSVASREVGLDKRAARTIRDEALAQLKEWLANPPEEDPPLDADPITDEAPALVWRCAQETEWGPCQQPALLEGDLCVFHAEVHEKDLTPDRAYHQAVVEGRKTPVQAFLTATEMNALVGGRYKGDGRRLDAWTCHDPLTGVVDV